MTKFRTKVFKVANEIEKSIRCGKSISLKKAWKVYNLEKSLRNGIVWFTFRKKDGSIHLVQATLQGIDKYIKGTGKESYKSIPFYDMKKEGIRSFKPENFLATY